MVRKSRSASQKPILLQQGDGFLDVLKGIGNFIKDNKIISNGLGAIGAATGNKWANVGAQVARQLGLGTKRRRRRQRGSGHTRRRHRIRA